jgi:hypothetical protein
MKYHNNLTKGSQDIERTSSGLPTDIPTDIPTDRPTDRQVQSNMPLFFEGGHKYQHPIPNSSKDIAQVKVFSLKCDADAADADTGVMTIALRTVVPAS